jgi:hypothetical protein
MPDTRAPISPQRGAARRANAAVSDTPPPVDEHVRRNHCFRASSFAVIRFEDLQEVAKLTADLIALLEAGEFPGTLRHRAHGLAQQIMLRGARLEAGLFTSAFNEAVDTVIDRPFAPISETMVGGGDIEITRTQNRNYGVAEGFRRLAKESNV